MDIYWLWNLFITEIQHKKKKHKKKKKKKKNTEDSGELINLEDYLPFLMRETLLWFSVCFPAH